MAVRASVEAIADMAMTGSAFRCIGASGKGRPTARYRGIPNGGQDTEPGGTVQDKHGACAGGAGGVRAGASDNGVARLVWCGRRACVRKFR